MLHIVFQEADINALKNSFQLDESLTGEIIQIKDDFAVGPLNDIYSAVGIAARTKWWREVLAGGGYNNNFAQQDNSWFYAVSNVNNDFETISNYNKYFIQPSFGFFSTIDMYKITYSFSIACRASYLDFNRYIYREIDGDKSIAQNNIVYLVNKEYYNKSLYLLEPCVSNKVGLKNIYVVIQGQFMIPYSNQIDVRYTKFSPVAIMSLGLQYNFVFKKQKVKTE